MKKKAIGAISFIIIFALSFRFFLYIDGNIGHNWDWPFPSLSIFYENIRNLSLYTWDSYNLGFVGDLRIVHLTQNLFFSFVGPLVGIKTFFFCLFLGITIVSFYGFKRLLDFQVKESSLNYIPALLYAFSPFLFNDIIGGSWVMWMSYACSPIYFISVLKYFTSGSPKYLLFSLLISIFVMIALQHMFLVNLLLFLYLINAVVILRTEDPVAIIKRSFIFFTLMILVNTYWILPFASTFFDFTKDTILHDGGAREFDTIRNSRQSIWNILNLGGYFDRNMYLYSMPQALKNSFYVSVVLAWFAIVWSFLREKRRIEKQKIAFWIISLLILIIFVKGGNRPFSGLTIWLYENLPLMRLFRSPQHLMFIPAFITPVLLALSLNYFYKNSIYKKIILVGFASMVVIWTGGWWFNGDLGHKTLMDQRRDFIDFYKLDPVLVQYYKKAHNDKSDYRSFFLPAIHSPTYKKTENQNRASGYQPEYLYLNKPTFTTESNKFANDVEISFCDESGDFDYIKYLSLFSVKDIILRSDITPLHSNSVRCWNNKRTKNRLDSNIAIERFMDGEYTTAYRVKEGYSLEHIYSAPEVSIIAGHENSLVPLTRTSYLNGYPALAFTEQQGTESLRALFADRNKTAISNQILFANKNFDDLVVDMAKAGISRTDSSTVDAHQSATVQMGEEGEGSISIKQAGDYGIWVGGAAGTIDKVEAVMIAGDEYVIEEQEGSGRFLQVGSKYLEKGNHSVHLIDNDDDSTYVRPEVLLISKEKQAKYEELLRSREIRYLFHNDPGQALRPGETSSIYIPASGEYEANILLRLKKSQQESLRTFDELLSGDKADGWEFRLKEKKQYGKRRSPVFIFSDNFSRPMSLEYPLMNGMWRWMSGRGSILLFNPSGKPVKVDISFSIASFKEKRELSIVLNREVLKNLTLSKPEISVGKRILGAVSDIERFAMASGKPLAVNLKKVVLKPGMNELLLKTDPGAERAGKDGKFLLSIAVSDNIDVKLSGGMSDAASWSNSKAFDSKIKNGELLLNDIYGSGKREVAWVTRRFPGADLADFPNFTLIYALFDNNAQGMEIGFRIDTNGDGEKDIYFARTLSDPISTNKDRFEINLLEETRKSFPEASLKKILLVGIDLFPHKKWGLNIPRSAKSIYTYRISGMQVTSGRSAEALLGVSDFAGAEFSGDASYKISRDDKEILATIPLDYAKGWSSYGKLKIPLKGDLLDKATHIILPFRISDEEVQNVWPLVAYDTTGDGRANSIEPLSRKAPIHNWRLVEKSLKRSMTLYEADLPKSFIAEDAVGQVRLTKNSELLVPGLDDNAPDTSEEMFRLAGDKIVINLSNGIDPKNFHYEINYMPKNWIRNSMEFEGFKEYFFETGALKKNTHGNFARPIDLIFDLEAKPPTAEGATQKGWFSRMGVVTKEVHKRTRYNFNLKAPAYISLVLSRLENIQQTTNMPVVVLGNKAVEFSKQEIDADKGAWSKATVSFQEGEHLFTVEGRGALGADIVEIRPLTNNRKKTRIPPQTDFKKINPTRYIVDVKGVKGPFTLVFSENFHRGWKAYVRHAAYKSTEAEPWSALLGAISDRGGRTEIPDHLVLNGYANGWIVHGYDGKDIQIVLEYKPQRLLEAGVLISIFTLFGCVGYWGYGCSRRRNKDSDI